MDLLYSRYASPMDLISLYINRRRFGKFVESVLDAEYQRKKDEAERTEDWKLWVMYTQLLSNGLTDESFNDWKLRVCKPTNAKRKSGGDENLTEDGMKSIVNKLFPS